MRATAATSSCMARMRSSRIRAQDPRVVIIEYEVHGKIIRTGASYDNRFISVVTIEDRKIVQWRDYMDSLTAMTAVSQTRWQKGKIELAAERTGFWSGRYRRPGGWAGFSKSAFPTV